MNLFCIETDLVEASLAHVRKFVEREKQNGRAEIEERALVLRETTRDQYYKLILQEYSLRLDFDALFEGLSEFNPVLICSCYKGSIIIPSN